MKWIKKFLDKRTKLQKIMMAIWGAIIITLFVTVPAFAIVLVITIAAAAILWYTLDALHEE